MPIITTLVTLRPGAVEGQSPSASRATSTWPTISAGVRLRTSFCVPVWQKRQFSVQPTWDETHSVPRSASGNIDGLEFDARPGAQQPFAGAVAGNLLGHDLRPRQGEMRRHLARGNPWPDWSWRRNRARHGHRSSSTTGARACAPISPARRPATSAAVSAAGSSPIREAVVHHMLQAAWILASASLKPARRIGVDGLGAPRRGARWPPPTRRCSWRRSALAVVQRLQPGACRSWPSLRVKKLNLSVPIAKRHRRALLVLIAGHDLRFGLDLAAGPVATPSDRWRRAWRSWAAWRGAWTWRSRSCCCRVPVE